MKFCGKIYLNQIGYLFLSNHKAWRNKRKPFIDKYGQMTFKTTLALSKTRNLYCFVPVQVESKK